MLKRIIPDRSSLVLMIFGILFAVVMAEIGLRILLPGSGGSAYNVLFLEPDIDTGWTHPRNFDFQWKGLNPNCIEFDHPVHMNNYGFRDNNDWELEKANNTIRIILLGDSYVEAMQVPYEQTPAYLLENMLSEAYPDLNFEVLNFGVSNYSVGQYQLVYEHLASQFQADYVIFTTAFFQMNRSLRQNINSSFTDQYDNLNIRPTYRLDDNDALEFVPARDHQVYVEQIENLTNGEFGADRSTLNRRKIPLYLYGLIGTRGAISLVNSFRDSPHPPLNTAPVEIDNIPELALNYEIMHLLKTQVEADGAGLLFVDFFSYFGSSQSIVDANREFAENEGIGFIDLSSLFRETDALAIYPCDEHFNQHGHAIFARTMFDWLVAEANFDSE